MKQYTEEFENAEITITRRQFAEALAESINRMAESMEGHIDEDTISLFMSLLTLHGADVMAELFDLEVED